MTALRAVTSLRVASRGSALAMAQAALAVQALQHHDAPQVGAFFGKHVQHLGLGLGAKVMV